MLMLDDSAAKKGHKIPDELYKKRIRNTLPAFVGSDTFLVQVNVDLMTLVRWEASDNLF